MQAKDVFGNNISESFISTKITNITKDSFAEEFYVVPYWKTTDGTIVYGEAATKKVNDAPELN